MPSEQLSTLCNISIERWLKWFDVNLSSCGFYRFSDDQLSEYRIAIILMGDFDIGNEMQVELVQSYMMSQMISANYSWAIAHFWYCDHYLAYHRFRFIVNAVFLGFDTSGWRFNGGCCFIACWNRNYRVIQWFQWRTAVIQLFRTLQWLLRLSNIRVLRSSSGRKNARVSGLLL